jgi:DNA repair exonuclease SbcCD ATPase subunit
MKFKTLKVQNFLSFGEMQTLDLSNPGFYLIQGINHAVRDNVEGDSNGAGKSSLLDGILLSLFNKVSKDLKLEKIINEQVKKDCMVELEFELGADTYIIERWLKKDGKKDALYLYKGDKTNLISSANKTDTQEQIEALIQFNYKTFINAIMMTQEQISGFISSDPSKKKEIIENILQLNLLTKYNTIASQKRKITQKEYDILYSQEMNAVNLINTIRSTLQAYVDSCNEKKKLNQKEITLLQSQLDTLSEIDIALEKQKIKDNETNVKLDNELSSKLEAEKTVLSSLTSGLKTNQDSLNNYNTLIAGNADFSTEDEEEELSDEVSSLKLAIEHKDHCPTCDNTIETVKFDVWKKAKLRRIKSIQDSINNKKDMAAKAADSKGEWTKKAEELREVIKKLNVNIAKSKENIQKLEQEKANITLINTMDIVELENLEGRKSTLSATINEKKKFNPMDKVYVEGQMKELTARKEEKANLEHDTKKLRKRLQILKWWEDSFSSKKNSMKSWCINNIIGYFNERIKYYVERMFYGTVSLHLDRDLNEVVTTKNRDRTYEQYSGGEKSRLNLSILFALNDLVRSSAVDINILFLDEVLSNYLDAPGIATTLEILKDMGNTGVYIIDHAETLKDCSESFKTILVEKGQDEFSKIIVS